MDNPTNGKFARAPTVEDLVNLCRSLNDHQVKYVLIGGFAVILYGFVRGTRDIDLLVDDDELNIKKIKQALSVLPDNAVQAMKDDELAQYSVIRIADEIVVDLLSKACQITYEEACKNVNLYEIDGIEIPVANAETLIKMKDTVRPSDKMDVDFLKSLLSQDKGQKT